MKTLLICHVFLLACVVLAQDELLIGEWIAGDESSYLSLNFAISNSVIIRIGDRVEETVFTGIWYLDDQRLILAFDDEVLTYDVLVLLPTELVLAGGGLDEAIYFVSQGVSSPSGSAQPTEVQAPVPTTSPVPPTSSADSQLTGKWHYSKEEMLVLQEETLYFIPDGRYFAVMSSQPYGHEATVTQEEGTFSVIGSELILMPYCAQQKRFSFSLLADQLTLSWQDTLGHSQHAVYIFELGSQNAAITEVQAIDRERQQANQAYLARTPIGSVRPGHYQQAGVPADPNAANIIAGATVFTQGELYTYVSDWSYVFDIYGQLQSVSSSDIAFNSPKMATLNYSRGTYRDTTQWFFMPNGRYYAISEIYGMATSLNPLTPHVYASWGKYHIEGDVLIIAEDAGEQSVYQLLDGRRVMSHGETGICYKEVQWATEELGAATQELRD